MGILLSVGAGLIDRGHNRRVQRGSVLRGMAPNTALSRCAMCSGASLLYGISRVAGKHQTFFGEEERLRSRGVAVEVLRNEERIRPLREFIERSPKTVERRHRCRVF